MSRIESDKISLDYNDKGSGAPLILVHGTLEDQRSWFQQTETFAENFRVIAYSRRYHFPNAARGDETDYAPALHARDLGALLDALQIARAHIAGASYGAYIALMFATLYPARVCSLVLAEPPIIPWLMENVDTAPTAQAFYERAWKPAGDALARDDHETGLALFVDGVNRPGTFARLHPDTRARLMQNVTALKIETRSPDYFQVLPEQNVAALDVPVLLLGAQYSPAHFAPILDRLESLLGRAERVTIPNTGHAMNLGNASFYNATVRAFLYKQTYV